MTQQVSEGLSLKYKSDLVLFGGGKMRFRTGVCVCVQGVCVGGGGLLKRLGGSPARTVWQSEISPG